MPRFISHLLGSEGRERTNQRKGLFTELYTGKMFIHNSFFFPACFLRKYSSFHNPGSMIRKFYIDSVLESNQIAYHSWSVFFVLFSLGATPSST